MALFRINGPFSIPVSRREAGREVDLSSLSEFWDLIGPDRALARGCYAFGIKTGRGVTPIYVGKATKTFRQECFALHKLRNVNSALLDYKRGRPVLFLAALDQRQGAPNLRAIKKLEIFLIQNALARNPNLLNIHHASPWEDFVIAGVFGSGRGKPSTSAKAFGRALGL